MSIVALFPLFIFFAFLVFGIGGTVLWIWALIDCATNEPPEGNDKVIWILIIVFTHWVGAIIYELVRRPERMRRYGR
jgi:hypothetical protein